VEYGRPTIEEHGLIGDLRTAALVGTDGSIDFACFPRFDSPTVFAALLDPERGGRFQIAPRLPDARPQQLYLPDSNVLLTRFRSQDGVVELSDFMPVSPGPHVHDIVRRAKVIRGDVELDVLCDPRFDYGRASHKAEAREREVLFRSEGEDGIAFRLVADVPLEVRNGAATGRFRLRTGETACFVLEEAREGHEPHSRNAEYVSSAFKDTMNYWRRWIARCTYEGRWKEVVDRSALTLKLLTSVAHGSMVAAPTFGLPEALGGQRNWDYRYTWIRDASFTVYALIRLGYTEEASDFLRWIEERCGELSVDDGASLGVLYTLEGSPEVPESELSHWSGYRDSRPVRIGNHAYSQLQLDIYGGLLDAVYLQDKHAFPISFDLWGRSTRVVDWVASSWSQPDEGIWETRSGRREYLYSRVLCWVALDRAVRLAHKRGLPAPLDRWIRERDRLHADVLGDFWNEERGAFVSHKETTELDASSLLMPLLRFISPTDPRWLSHLRAVEEDLVEDALVYRYRSEHFDDGLPGREGTFVACSFWYVECLARAGDLRKARLLFEKTLAYSNHLGLFSEEIGPGGEHLGNFPQALSHLALISAAHVLQRNISRAGEADL